MGSATGAHNYLRSAVADLARHGRRDQRNCACRTGRSTASSRRCRALPTAVTCPALSCTCRFCVISLHTPCRLAVHMCRAALPLRTATVCWSSTPSAPAAPDCSRVSAAAPSTRDAPRASIRLQPARLPTTDAVSLPAAASWQLLMRNRDRSAAGPPSPGGGCTVTTRSPNQYTD